MPVGSIFPDLSKINDPGVTLGDINGDFVTGFAATIGRIDTEWGSAPDPGDPSVFNEDMSEGSTTIYRLREGIERFFISDINNPAATAMAQSELFVMFDDISEGNPEYMNHIPGGCNILYMDGHVKFMRYPGDFPICRGWMIVLGLLEEPEP